MALTHNIQRRLMAFAKNGYNDIVIPNFFYGHNECDLFRATASDYVYEYEIKISRSDYFNDFSKNGRDEPKHKTLASGIGKNCPNRFFYVVPDGLMSRAECPAYAGLIYYKNEWLSIVKPAPLIHNRKIAIEVYRDVCRTLSARDKDQRARIAKIRNGDVDRELARVKRELEAIKQEKKDLTMQILMERRHNRKQPT